MTLKILQICAGATIGVEAFLRGLGVLVTILLIAMFSIVKEKVLVSLFLTHY